jgi:hypothetical protein
MPGCLLASLLAEEPEVLPAGLREARTRNIHGLRPVQLSRHSCNKAKYWDSLTKGVNKR